MLSIVALIKRFLVTCMLFFDGGSPLKTLPCHVVVSLMELMDPSACPNTPLFVYVILSHSCRLFVPCFLTWNVPCRQSMFKLWPLQEQPSLSMVWFNHSNCFVVNIIIWNITLVWGFSSDKLPVTWKTWLLWSTVGFDISVIYNMHTCFW